MVFPLLVMGKPTCSNGAAAAQLGQARPPGASLAARVRVGPCDWKHDPNTGRGPGDQSLSASQAAQARLEPGRVCHCHLNLTRKGSVSPLRLPSPIQ